MAAFDNPIIFGLAVKNSLSDIPNKDRALKNLNLYPADLHLLGGINTYATNDSFQALSNTDESYELTFTRLLRDSDFYIDALSEGTDTSRLYGNITINGVLAASAIRYFTLDLYDKNTGNFQPLDISTSRVSSWSELTDSNKIMYGSEFRITQGSKLSAGSIKFGTQAASILFPGSETATHVIKLSSNGIEYSVYAMKDTPITFVGYFASGTIKCQPEPASLVSFKIYRADYTAETPFVVRGFVSNTSIKTINFVKSESRTRTIEIYTRPATIALLSLPKLGMTSIPKTQLIGLSTLELNDNNFARLPELSAVAPNLRTLVMNSNGLFRESKELTYNLSLRLPDTIRSLTLGNTYQSIGTYTDGGVVKSVLERLKLTQLNMTGGPTKLTGVCPSVSATCITYIVANNDLRSLPERGLLRPASENNLRTIDLGNNPLLSLTQTTSAAYLNNNGFSTSLASLKIGTTCLPTPDLRNCAASLQSFATAFNLTTPYVGSLSSLKSQFKLHNADGVYKFENCNNLTLLSYQYSELYGDLPIFTNTSLNSIGLQSTSLSGVIKPGDAVDTYSLYNKTFEACRDILTNLTFTTNHSAFPELPIEPGSLDLPRITTVIWQTNNYNPYTPLVKLRGGTTGNTPAFSNNSVLKEILLTSNRFENITPVNKDLKSSLAKFWLSRNLLTTTNNLEGLNLGFIFTVPFTSLTNIDFSDNKLTSVSNVTNLPNLQTLNLNLNEMTGYIPSFNSCPKLVNLYLNNNKFVDFIPGGFDSLTKIKRIEIGNNVDSLGKRTLTIPAVEAIISSLYNMWITSRSTSPNRNVYVLFTSSVVSAERYAITSSTVIAQARALVKDANYSLVGVIIPAETVTV